MCMCVGGHALPLCYGHVEIGNHRLVQWTQDILRAVLRLSAQPLPEGPKPMDLDSLGQERGGPAADSEHASATEGSSGSGAAVLEAAGRVFGSLLGSGSSGKGQEGLNEPKRISAKPRVLWQQRAFTVAAELLVQVRSAARQTSQQRCMPF